MDAQSRRLRGQMAANLMHSQGKTNTAPAREAFQQRFYDQVDPDRTLPADVRERRAAQARTAYYQGLALRRRRATGKATEPRAS